MVVERQSERLSTLRAVMADAGFQVVVVLGEDADLYAAAERLGPDAIIVGADNRR